METSYSDKKLFRVVTPLRLEDVLVLKSLSITILTLIYNRVARESYKDLDVVDLIPSFYDSVLQHGKTSRIYKIDLNPYLPSSASFPKRGAFLIKFVPSISLYV